MVTPFGFTIHMTAYVPLARASEQDTSPLHSDGVIILPLLPQLTHHQTAI